MSSVWVSLNSPTLVDVGFTGENGVYVYVKPSSSSLPALGKLAQDLGFEPDPSKFHVTVMYSTIAPPELPKVYPEALLKATVSKVDTHEGHDGKLYLAAQLKSKSLNALHQKWKDAGAQHSYPSYMAHMTLWSGVTDSPELRKSLAVLNNRLSLTPLTCHFSAETAADLKDD